MKTIREDYLLVHKGAENGFHGVGFIISAQLANKVKNVRLFNNQMIALTLPMNKGDLDLIQVYAPQQGRPNDEKDAFYENFQDLVDDMPNHDNQLILGVLNGHIGPRTLILKDVVGPFSMGDIRK